MDPKLAALFAAEFTAEWNRLAADASAGETRLTRELDAVDRPLAHLVDAIANGLRSPILQVKLSALETERDRLRQALADAKPTDIRLMPNLGHADRATLDHLHDAISAGDNLEAIATARALIVRVVIHPAPPHKPPGITIEGQLAAMLKAAQIIDQTTQRAVNERARPKPTRTAPPPGISVWPDDALAFPHVHPSRP
ncbi:hypothetical protein [Sediminicoccus sp. KRV36]|uniref:hypothetical protein n=1 Tax=Sediminicoccus sp. KRV36 TaxID=3133721 RepID=UPI002010C403|nr:hypothetical protein [Sediminicoccus rosea]UPY37017.1 hypothetical protein LHU95_22830 [Sediminicoccus rosea]